MTISHPLFDCPATILVERMASRWTVPAMALLSETPVRFNQLRRQLDGISQKMLSQTLKTLEREGLVSRTAAPTVPVTVEYALTPLGLSLVEAFGPLRRWSEDNIDTVARAPKVLD